MVGGEVSVVCFLLSVVLFVVGCLLWVVCLADEILFGRLS